MQLVSYQCLTPSQPVSLCRAEDAEETRCHVGAVQSDFLCELRQRPLENDLSLSLDPLPGTSYRYPPENTVFHNF